MGSENASSRSAMDEWLQHPSIGVPQASFATPATPDSITSPYPPDSVFAIPTAPMSVAAPQALAKASAETPLQSATSAWTQARTKMSTNLSQLETAILAAFLGEAPSLVADLQKKVTKLSGFANAFDTSLSDALSKASAASDAAGRSKSLKAASGILDRFRSHLKTHEKLVAQIDTNPFGVKLALQQELSSSLDQVGKALH